MDALERKGAPIGRRLRSGLVLLDDAPGNGEFVRRQHRYAISLRLWLRDARRVQWTAAWGPVGGARLEDNGETLLTVVRIDRASLMHGLFYGVEGMRVGGIRRLRIAPHLAYGDRGGARRGPTEGGIGGRDCRARGAARQCPGALTA